MYTTPPFHFYIFLLIFNGVLWSLHYWVYRNLVRALGTSKRFGTKRARRSIAAMFVLFDMPWVFLYIYRMVKGETPNALGWLIMYPFAVWQAVLFFWVIVLAVYSLLARSSRWGRAGWKRFRRVNENASSSPVPITDETRRKFLRGGAIGLTGYALIASTAGVIMRDEYEVNEKTLVIPSLPEAFKGFRIALISDIHSGMFLGKAEMQRYAQVVNGLHADMIALPGDFVNSLDSEIYPFVEAFSTLHAPHGVYGVTGNHDYFANADLVCRESEQAGIRMLRNEHVVLERGGSRITLFGIDDRPVSQSEPQMYVQTGKSETIESMMKGAPVDATKILLCHRPYPFEEFAQVGMDVMLSGHTHGGQIVLAKFGGMNLSFAALASRFVHGYYRSQANPNAQMYISRGIGTVGLPLRINCPPEVTTIVLG